MNTDSPLVIPHTTEVDPEQVTDEAIIEITRSFNRFYEDRRNQVVIALRQLPSVLEVLDRISAGTSYRAVIPPELRRALQAGKASWDQYKDGLKGAVLRDNETGQILCHVKLEEVHLDLLAAINQLAIQRSLAGIVQTLEAIDEKVTSVLEGQKNDRLAIVESGIQLYVQAMAAANPQNRQQLLIESVHQLNEGRQQLILALESEIHALEGELPRNSLDLFLRSLTKNVAETITLHATSVQKSLQAILRASYVLAAAYQALDEPESLRISLRPAQQTLLETGTRGASIARWLPYDRQRPPEEFWHLNLLEAAERLAVTGNELEQLPFLTMELPLEAGELSAGGDDGRPDL